MASNYDVYMCRPDNRPILTVGKLRQLQTTMSNNWCESVDVHTAIKRARDAGYKVPFDIFQNYLADEQKRMALAINSDNPPDGINSFWADLQKSSTKSFVEKLVKTHLWPNPRKNKGA